MMAKKGNPVSEYLAEIGRRGGRVKTVKGFAAMSDKQRKELSKRGVEARKQKRPQK